MSNLYHILIGKDVGGSPSQLNEAVSEPGPSRKRGTSLSITYNDSEDSSYPWYFQLHVEDDDDQESEILSVQVCLEKTMLDLPKVFGLLNFLPYMYLKI